MIRLTLFYLFASFAVLSCIMLFFTKNRIKTALFFFSVSLFSSLICVIFRNSIPALFILLSGALCSFIFAAASSRLENHTVQARGATPKFLKLFSALCCIGFFFAVILPAAELKDSVPQSKAHSQAASQEKDDGGLFFYLAGIGLLPFLSLFAGRRILVYKENKANDNVL